MSTVKTTKLDNIQDDETEYTIEYEEYTHPINIGDAYMFWFGGWSINICETEHERIEINENDIAFQADKIDFVHDFWRKCYKVNSTDFDLSKV